MSQEPDMSGLFRHTAPPLGPESEDEDDKQQKVISTLLRITGLK